MKTGQAKNLNLEFHPVTPKRWTDFETLFGAKGACGGCWCMLWRLTRKEFEQQKGEANRQAMKTIVESGEIPGLLAYSEKQPVAWCSVAPRENFPALERSRVLKKIDDKPVWSISCFFIHKGRWSITSKSRAARLSRAIRLNPKRRKPPMSLPGRAWPPFLKKPASLNAPGDRRPGRLCAMILIIDPR